MERISRRSFLKCIGAGTAAVAAMGLLGGCDGVSMEPKVYRMNEKASLLFVDFTLKEAKVWSQRPFFETPEDADSEPVIVRFDVKNNNLVHVLILPDNISIQDWLNGEDGGTDKMYDYCKKRGGFAAMCDQKTVKNFGYGSDQDCGSSYFKPTRSGFMEWFIWAPKGWKTLDLYYTPEYAQGWSLHFRLDSSETVVV